MPEEDVLQYDLQRESDDALDANRDPVDAFAPYLVETVLKLPRRYT